MTSRIAHDARGESPDAPGLEHIDMQARSARACDYVKDNLLLTAFSRRPQRLPFTVTQKQNCARAIYVTVHSI